MKFLVVQSAVIAVAINRLGESGKSTNGLMMDVDSGNLIARNEAIKLASAGIQNASSMKFEMLT